MSTELTCEECGNPFEHTARGRRPKKCPACRGDSDVNYQRKVVKLNTFIYEGDMVLLQSLRDYLGCSTAEAVRTAIRALSTHLPLPKVGRESLERPLTPFNPSSETGNALNRDVELPPLE